MSYEEHFFEVLGVAFALLFGIIFLFYVNIYSEQSDAIVGGVIAYKGYENSDSNTFRYVPAKYYFVVNFNFEIFGFTVDKEKRFDVERDVFLSYEVGDYFNILDCNDYKSSAPD